MVDNVSQAILEGAAKRYAWPDGELSRRAQIAVTRIESVRRGTAEFDDDEVMRIEDATDMTCGQLANLVTEPDGGPLTEISNSWAEFRHSVKDTGTAADQRQQKRVARPAAAG